VGGINSLEVKLAGAIANIENGDVNGALGKLLATVNELDALVLSGRLASADAAPTVTLIQRTIQSLSR
jgi:triphosphoribosyl-dephospho-CoA synthetase